MSLDSIEKSVRTAAQNLHEVLHRHPRRVAAAVCTLLGGFAVTAFGIAPLAPDAADLPQRLVTQELPLSGIDQQLEDLAQHALELSRTDLTRATDSEIRALERERIVEALEACAGNQTRAAERLGVSRRTLSTWLERHQIPRPRKSQS